MHDVKVGRYLIIKSVADLAVIQTLTLEITRVLSNIIELPLPVPFNAAPKSAPATHSLHSNMVTSNVQRPERPQRNPRLSMSPYLFRMIAILPIAVQEDR